MKQNQLKKGLVILACLCFLSGFSLLGASTREKHEEKFEKTESLARNGKVSLRNIAGRIEVKTWDKEQVKIDALKLSEASTLSRAAENSKKVTIEVKKEDNLLRIETKYPEHGEYRGKDSLNVSVEFRLWIPDKASAEVRSISGDVVAEGIGGSVGVDTVSGTVDVKDAQQGVDCESISGELVLQNIKGDVYANTTSGTISASKIIGSIHAVSVSGSIEFGEVSEAKVIKANSVSGDIRYQGTISSEGRCSLKTTSGRIEMTLPSDSSFELEADTFSGHIDSDFPIQVSGRIAPKEVRGVVNKGGASITLSSFSGSITIKSGSLRLKKS